MDDDLVVRAAIRDELSRPLEAIRREIRATGRDVEGAGGRADVAGRGFGRLGDGIGRMARTAGRVGITAIAGTGAALVAATGFAATFGIKTAASMQNARIAFSTMLGSAKRADTFLRDLSDFAAKTPFEFPELQTAASSLISAGIEADKVIPIMTTLGDVTSGMGTGSEGVRRATVALQQMSAAGRITGEDLNQLRDAGIPVYDLLAKATGKSKAEVVALSQAGKLGAKELGLMMEALESGKGLERFSGLMEKQSASLGGVWSTLKDTVGMGLANALEPAVPLLSRLTLKASALASKGMGPLQDGIGWVVEKAEDLIASGKIGDWADTAKTEVVEFWQAVGPLVGELGTLGKDALPVVGSALGTVVDLIKVGARVLGPLVGGFNDLGSSEKMILLAAAAVFILSGRLEGAQVKTAAFAARMTDATTRQNLLRGALGATGAALMTFGGQVGQANEGLGAAMTLAGAMATGFAAAGPVGLALGGIAGVFAAFRDRSNEAAQAQERLDQAGKAVAETLDRQTGALTENTRVMAAKKLAENGTFDAAKKVGASYNDVLDAALGVAGAQERVNTAMDNYSVANTKFNPNGTTARSKEATAALEKLGGSIDSTSGAIARERSEISQTNTALGKMPAAIDKVDKAKANVRVNVDTRTPAQQLKDIQDRIDRLRGKTISIRAIESRAGDTVSSHARGRGNIASTLAAHAATSRVAGTSPRISNAFIGGGGKGRGSGDHQAGRALDLVGGNLGAYAKATRDAGGYAAMHGTGADRHLHAVPAGPMGDTATSRAATAPRAARSSSNSAEVPAIVIGPGAIVVTNPADTVDLEQGIADGIETYIRNAQERG